MFILERDKRYEMKYIVKMKFILLHLAFIVDVSTLYGAVALF